MSYVLTREVPDSPFERFEDAAKRIFWVPMKDLEKPSLRRN